jgi:hypothetical protein
MSDLQHLPLCDPEDEVLPFEFVPARGNTEESNRKVSDQSRALPTSRPSGIAVARSGIYLILVLFKIINLLYIDYLIATILFIIFLRLLKRLRPERMS